MNEQPLPPESPPQQQQSPLKPPHSAAGVQHGDSGAGELPVQGLPRSLMSALYALAGLLAAVGAACMLYAARGHLNIWMRLGLVAALPIVLVAVHIVRARRRGEVVWSSALGALVAAHLFVLPAGLYLAAWAGPIAAMPPVFVYAVAVMWYGAYYHIASAIAAASALIFAAALIVPLYWQPGPLVSGLILLAMAAAALAVALYLRRIRRARTALTPLQRRSVNEPSEEDAPGAQG